jgi:hypothetical protein
MGVEDAAIRGSRQRADADQSAHDDNPQSQSASLRGEVSHLLAAQSQLIL